MPTTSFWQESNQIQLQNIKRCEEWQSMDLRTRYTAAHLERLKHSNVINDAFHIWHDGPFGTINGFRLGRIPDWPVDWGEINAALGQACLLLQILADRCQFVFHVYRLIPLGNYSRIEKLSDDKAVYELYGSGEFQISRLFWNRRFDLALVAFLNCVQQLAEYAERMDKTFKLPYRYVHMILLASILTNHA
jgi:beclin 1